MKVNGLEYSQENVDSMNRTQICEIVDSIKILIQTGRLAGRDAISIITILDVPEEVLREIMAIINLKSEG